MLLLLIGFASWKGIETIFDGFNRWTWTSLILLSMTLLVAAVGMRPHATGLDILINGYLIAQGEVVVVADKYGVRITDIITPSERMRRLSR